MNKRIALPLIIIAFTIGAKGQNVTYDGIFENLDKSKISTGILYNKAISLSSYKEFTGSNNSVICDFDIWFQIYHELYNAHVNTPSIPDVKEVENRINMSLLDNKVPIGIINMEYNEIKSNAVSDNLLLYQDHRLYDGSNTTQTPYSENRCFVASVLEREHEGLNISFVFNEEFLFTNLSEQIDYYEVSFDNGNGFQRVEVDDMVEISYQHSGEKIIEIDAILNSGNALNCKSRLVITNTDFMLKSSSSTSAAIPDNGSNGEVIQGTYNNAPYYGNYGIWYGCNNSQIKKPLIFVEGFDPLDDFTLDNSGSSLYSLANQQGLLDRFRNEGYDVIILNFKDGGAKIQANSMVLKALINKINSTKVTNNELVIIGASMGGLISRYTLSYMESINEDHQTRLFNSFDSPHQGAYISLAAQHFLGQFEQDNNAINGIGIQNVKEIADLLYMVNCDAAKQMLVYHFSATNNNKANPHQMRLDFIQEINSLPNNGYPQKCKNIAIAEGSGNGTGQGYSAGSVQLDIDKFQAPVSLDMVMRAVPNNQLTTILELDVRIRVGSGEPWEICWDWGRLGSGCIGGDGYGWVSSPAFTDINIAVDNTKQYDNCPGGSNNVIQNFHNVLDNVFNLGTTYTNRECFIPTISALDLKNTSDLFYNIHSNITNNQDFVEINNRNITPFDALFVGTKNEPHIIGGITSQMADWAFNQVVKENVYIQNKIFSSESKQYEASENIFAGNNVTGGINGDVIIKNNSDITFVAGNSITLKPGFTVEAGSKFSAYISNNNCSISTKSATLKSTAIQTNNNKNNSINGFNENYDVYDNNNSKIKIYPNPSQGQFEILTDLESDSKGVIKIYNSTGQIVYQDNIESELKMINLKATPGIYIIKVSIDNKKVLTQKMIIE